MAIKFTKNISPEADAKGQSEKNHKGGSNDGTVSANPRVISGNEDGDATFPFVQNKVASTGKSKK